MTGYELALNRLRCQHDPCFITSPSHLRNFRSGWSILFGRSMKNLSSLHPLRAWRESEVNEMNRWRTSLRCSFATDRWNPVPRDTIDLMVGCAYWLFFSHLRMLGATVAGCNQWLLNQNQQNLQQMIHYFLNSLRSWLTSSWVLLAC